ncbi:MAG: flavodoxin domain-containing protein, partial [Candidatus Omnitrophica bacterium]|nr:flavodoxin domain-containing protein [Candidatus Omnitrophota bacterium]
FWVGVIHWAIKNFHGNTFSTKNGTTYNSYLIMDEKVALIDGVYTPFACDLLENIKQITPLEKIDYIIANHVEVDHSGALPELMKYCPKAKIFGTAKCKEGLFRHYYKDWDFQVVKTGEKLKLGKKTLTFVETPMIHWPDSMFTYAVEDGILFSNDAFGQHYATSERFDDEVAQDVLMDEAAKYYANILMPFGVLITRKIEEIKKTGLPIKMIATSHGIIWRKDISKIINAYLSWAKNETKQKVVVVYETMYGSTGSMAREIVRGLMDAKISDVKLFDVNNSDRTEVIKEMLDAKGFLIGSSTHDNDMLPNIAGFLEFLKGLKPKNRVAGVFGSYGWSGGAVASIGNVLKGGGIEVIDTSLSVKFRPDMDELKKCYEFGIEFAKRIGF